MGVSSILNSLIENLDSDIVVSETFVPTKGLRQVIFDLVSSHNEGTPTVRQIPVDTAYEVAERSLVASASLPLDTRKFLVVRDVTNFLDLSAKGTATRNGTKNTDLLPITNPLSTAPHSLTAAGIRHARARWIAADPRIDDSVRPLVASAYAARPESAERVYLFAKLSATGTMVPAEIRNNEQVSALLAAFNPYAGGNSKLARSLRAKAQARDSEGRFAGTGDGVRLYIRSSAGKIDSHIGTSLGSGKDPSTVEIEVKNHPELGSGIIVAPADRTQALQGVTPENLLKDSKGQNVDQTRTDFLDVAELLKTKKDVPNGWTEDPNYKKESDSDPDKRYKSEDGYIVDVYNNYSGKKSDPAFKKQAEIDGGAENSGSGLDGKFQKNEPVYVVKRDATIYKGEGETEVVARVQSWGKVQVAANKDTEKFDKAIEDAPDVLEKPAAAETETYSAEDRVAAVAAKSGKNLSKVDAALKSLAGSNLTTPALTQFVGNSDSPITDRIKQIANGGDEEVITAQMMAAALSLPKDLSNLKDALVAVVDATLEVEDKDLKKAKAANSKKNKDEVKAELIKPAAQEKAPSELDKIDEAKPAKAPEVKAVLPETPAEGSKLLENDPDLSIQYGLGIDPYVPLEDKSGFPEGVSDEPQFIADNFNKFALEGGLRIALNRGDSSVRLQMKDEEGNNKGPAYTVEADAVRDALQLQGVDTNKILADLDEVSKTEDAAPTVSKATVAQVTEDASLFADLSGYKKVGEKQGSNEGGTYEDENGNRIYAKVAQSKLHADNEVLAAALYEALGIETAKLRKGILADGTEVVFSPMIEGAKPDLGQKLDDKNFIGKIQEGFAVDAWLANWDVAGTGYDNIVSDANGEPVRVDPGGALLFRAQGAPKGDAFNEEATEIDTLINGKNPYSTAVFGSMTEEQKLESAKALQKISDQQIDQLVNGIVSSDPEKAGVLADLLKLRRKSILDKYDLSTIFVPATTTPKGLESIVSRTGANGGGTIDFVDGSSPAQGFIVAMEPDVALPDGTLTKREEVVEAADFFDAAKGRAILEAFALKNAEKLGEPGFFLGTWHDAENGKVYLDVSEVAATEEEALARADARGELSVYDISTGNYVYTEKGKAQQNGESTSGTEQDSDGPATEEPAGDEPAGTSPVGGDQLPADSGLDAVPAEPEAAGLEEQPYPKLTTEAGEVFEYIPASKLQYGDVAGVDDYVGVVVGVKTGKGVKLGVSKQLTTFSVLNPKTGKIKTYQWSPSTTIAHIRNNKSAGEISTQYQAEYNKKKAEQSAPPSATTPAPTPAAEPTPPLEWKSVVNVGGVSVDEAVDPETGYILRVVYEQNSSSSGGSASKADYVTAQLLDENRNKIAQKSFGSGEATFADGKAAAAQLLVDTKADGQVSKAEPEVVDVPEEELVSEVVETNREVIQINTETTNLDVKIKDVGEGSVINWGLSTATITPTVNNTFDAFVKDAQGNDKKANFKTKEAAEAWVGDVIAEATALEENPITKNPAGEASKGFSVHKGGFLAPATEAQVESIKKMLAAKDITPERKQEIENLLTKEDLNKGEIGVVIGELKQAQSLPEEKLNPALSESSPGVLAVNKVSVGNGEIMEVKTKDGSLFSKDGLNIGAVMPSKSKSGAWTAITQDGDVSTIKLTDYASEAAALDAFGSYHTANGTFAQNPYGNAPEENAPEAETAADQIISDDDNNDLTPKDPTDILDPNLITDQLLKNNPDFEVMPNGDIKIGEATQTMKIGGKIYKYEAYARRTKRERFYVYMKETDLITGEQRVLKIGKEFHSFKALSSRIDKAKTAIDGGNPRGFFNHDKTKIQKYVPIAGAPEVDLTEGLKSYVNSEVGPKTPAELATALSSFFADISNDNYTVSKDVLDKLAADAGLPSSFVDEVIAKMAENKAKSAQSLPDSFFEGKGVPKAPHVSYDGETIVKKGDTVDWTDQKTGKVYRGVVESVIYKHNSKDYLYSDQMLVIFPDLNAEQGYESNRQRWRVSSNLKVAEPSSSLSEPFYPKLKEAMTQENVGTGETPEFVEPTTPPAPTNKTPKPITPSTTEQSSGPSKEDIFNWFGDTPVVTGDSVFNPQNGKSGKVTGNFMAPSGYAGFTIEYNDGTKETIDNETSGSAFNLVQKVDPASAPEPAKTPALQSDATPEIQKSDLGPSFVDVDGVKHPLYDSNNALYSDAILGTNTPRKWSELQSGDLLHVNDEWVHVVSAGYGDDGVFRILTDSIDNDGNHTLKTISLDEKKKMFLDMQTSAVVVPNEPKVPGSVELDKVIDKDTPATQESIDTLVSIANNWDLSTSPDLEKKYNDFIASLLFNTPEQIKQLAVNELVAEINAGIVNSDILAKSDKELTTEDVTGLADSVETSMANTPIGEEVANAATEVKELATELDASKSPAADADPNYDGYPVKKLKFEDVTIKGGKKAPFTSIGKITTNELKVGDVIRRGVGDKTMYRQIVAVGVDGIRGRITTRIIYPTEGNSVYTMSGFQKNQGKLETGTYYSWNSFKIYRPTESNIANGYISTPVSGTPQPLSATAEKVDGLAGFLNAQGVKDVGVNKKSEAGLAQLGLSGEIMGVPYNMLPTNFNPTVVWKEAFDAQKVKTKNDKYVITGAVVTSQDGLSTGIVTDTDKPNATLSVVWLHGPAAGNKENNILSNTVDDTENWVSPEGAKTAGVEVNAEKIQQGKDIIASKIKYVVDTYGPTIEAKKASIANQLAAEKLAKELKAAKAAALVKGSGAQIVDVAPVIGWDESAYPELPSLQTALDESKNKTGLQGVFGQEVLVDADSIEDSTLSIGVVENKGKPATRLTFGLTSWTLDDASTTKPGFLREQIISNPEVKTLPGVKISRITHEEGKISKVYENDYVTSTKTGKGEGKTYVIPIKDSNGNIIGRASIFRANAGTSTPKFVGVNTQGGAEGPLAYHNKVQVQFDDIATPEQIEAALKAVGVQQVRPATTIDTQAMLENKIIALFGDVPDGSENLTGEARQKVLDSVKDNYGFTAADMKPRNERGAVHFMMPKESAEKLTKALNFTNLFHGFAVPTYASDTYSDKAKWVYNEIFGNGSGASRSAADRALHGIYFTPGSGDADINNVGGAYVFTNKTPNETSSGHVGDMRDLKFDIDSQKVIARLGLYGNPNDKWGKLEGSQFSTLSSESLSEVMLKGEVLYEDLNVIRVREKPLLTEILQYFQDQGVTEINGKPLNKFFIFGK